jgi:hypothetical protein
MKGAHEAAGAVACRAAPRLPNWLVSSFSKEPPMEVLQLPGQFVYEALVLPRKRKEILLASVNEAVKFDSAPYRLGQCSSVRPAKAAKRPGSTTRAPQNGGLTASFSLGF